ncbi:MAG TPA: phosphoserine phosphatase, partial [Hyphomicrobiaceae bacterium]|nr:phosphoserine phosphatase [Hyphomicrobiaceae bacterium]
ERWSLAFPFSRPDCKASLGNCKCSHRPGTSGGALDVVVGDGRSDFCIASRAHLVLAKGQLAKHCQANDIAHWPIAGFDDATDVLAAWLARHARIPA